MSEKGEPTQEKAFRETGRREGTGQRGGVILPWRRVLAGAVLAGGIFAVLFLLATSVPPLVFLSALTFLPVGLWVGRGSQRPWLEGLFYGLFTAVIAMLVLFGFASGWPKAVAFAFAFLLAVPQGVLGAWLGNRFLRPRGPQESSS